MNKKVSIFQARLAKMQGAAAAAMADYQPGGVKVPDGIYIAKETCEMGESKTTGSLMVTVKFLIQEGEFKGLHAGSQYLVLEQQVLAAETQQPTGEHVLSDKGIQKARRWVEQHGIAFPEELKDLESTINAINDAAPVCRIRCTTNTPKGNDEPFQTSYILEVQDNIAGDAPSAAAEPPPASDTTDTQEGGQDGLTGMTRAELKAWITENNLTAAIKVTLKHTDDDVRNMIRECIAAQQTETTAEEIAPAEAAEADYVQPLLVFCASQGISEVTAGMTQDAIVEVMKTYQYVRTEITEEESTLLSNVGIPESNIIDPPAPTPPPAPAPKPVAPKVGLPKPGLPKPGIRPGLPGKK
jgi:hypothetical protein